MTKKILLFTTATVFTALLLIVTAALIWGGPVTPAPMATVLAAAGVQVYALDVRGHGDSAPKGHTAPNYRPDSGGWVSVGIRYWNDLHVVRFALTEEAKSFLTPEYDFNLAMNFAARRSAYSFDFGTYSPRGSCGLCQT